MKALYMIEFTEYERGWGSKHISTSFHSTMERAQREYDSAMDDRSGGVPDYYINPSPIKSVAVSDELYEKVIQTEETTDAYFDPSNIAKDATGAYVFRPTKVV